MAAAAATFAPGLLDEPASEIARLTRWNLLSRLENTLPGSGARALACLHVPLPNEAHLLAALHLAYGGLHLTVNVDDGIERAYGLLVGAKELPDDAPAAYRRALPRWRRCCPRNGTKLVVVSDPTEFAHSGFSARPLLVKLHGSLGTCRDGVVLPLPGAPDLDVTKLGTHRTASLDVLAASPFVLVTGYSGSDFASSSALLSRLRPRRFSWVAPQVLPDISTTLRAIDPRQPVAGRAINAIRALLPVTPPEWPTEPHSGPGFPERFAAWRATVPESALAAAYSSVLVDGGWSREAIVLRERILASSDGMGASSHAQSENAIGPTLATAVAYLESRVAAATASASRRSRLATVAVGAIDRAAGMLDATAAQPSGKRRALLIRQAIELSAMAAFLRREPLPTDALPSLRQLGRVYEHLGDTHGLAEVVGTRALVWLALGRPERARRCFQDASRLHPASVGVLAAVRDLLALSDAAAGEDSRVSVRRSRHGPEVGNEIDGRQLDAFVRALPKVELHVHLEGSVAPGTLGALARRNGDQRVPWDPDEISRWYRYRSYTDFFNAYVLVCDQLRTAEDFARVTCELGATMALQNVRYAEVTVSPVQHFRRGILPADLFSGLDEGRRVVEREHGVRLRWCAAAGTRRGLGAAIETVETVLGLHGLVSFGLAGLESAGPRAAFAPAFDAAREAGLHCVAHAGEASGASSVWQAIDVLGAERIGHGIRCIEDRALVARLRRLAIPLEVCPTSNVRTGLVPSLRRHPLPRLLDAGLAVSINTDDPAMFHTQLITEYVEVARACRLTPAALSDLARAGVRSAFLPRDDADALLAEIDATPVPGEQIVSAMSS